MDSRVPWSDLPQELIAEIAKFLETPIDIQNFRAVCRSWLSSCPRSSKLLSLLFPHKIQAPKHDPFVWPNRCLVLVASNIFILHPQQGGAPQNLLKPWMVRVEELNPGALQVQRPLTHNWNIKLPQYFPMDLNLSRTRRVTEVFKGYNLRRESANFHQDLMLGLDVNKVVLYSDSHGKSPATVCDFTVVVLFLVGRLYVVRLSDSHWESIKFGRVSRFDDVLNFRGKIFVIDRKGRLYRLCCKTLSYSCIVSHPVPSHPLAADTRKHLVELCGELCILHFCNSYFKVYKLKEGEGLWTEVNSLGEDRLLFLGPDCCFSALAEDFPGWKGNSIVYHLESFRTYRRDGHAFYSMHDHPDNDIYFAVYRMGDRVCKNINTLDGYTDVLWPPPLWLRYLTHHSRPMANTGLAMLAEEASKSTNARIVDDQDSRAPT